jgi:hypothetical protein
VQPPVHPRRAAVPPAAIDPAAPSSRASSWRREVRDGPATPPPRATSWRDEIPDGPARRDPELEHLVEQLRRQDHRRRRRRRLWIVAGVGPVVLGAAVLGFGALQQMPEWREVIPPLDATAPAATPLASPPTAPAAAPSGPDTGAPRLTTEPPAEGPAVPPRKPQAGAELEPSGRPPVAGSSAPRVAAERSARSPQESPRSSRPATPPAPTLAPSPSAAVRSPWLDGADVKVVVATEPLTPDILSCTVRVHDATEVPITDALVSVRLSRPGRASVDKDMDQVEPGVYRASVAMPPQDGDLRVRVARADRIVEIPVLAYR